MRLARLAFPVLAIASATLAGCGSSGPGTPAPKSLTVAQAQQLPLEEAGDLSIRQNLAEQPRKAILGRDTPGPVHHR
ncbi:MAG: hypothetical protein U0835_00715 [Isosphaeraceae bacterium]